MHIQIIQFRLKGLNHEGFTELCDQLAPTWAQIPGLLSKIWLSDPAASTYGGVYAWENKAAMEGFVQGELYRAVQTNPNFTDVTSRDFAVLEGPTRVTRGASAVRA